MPNEENELLLQESKLKNCAKKKNIVCAYITFIVI